MDAQIVIPVHSTDRPIRRAVSSVLNCANAGVVVVAHGVDPTELDIPSCKRVQVLVLEERLGLPGAAFNAGLNSTSAPWVGVLGSDDWFEPGALEAMLSHAKARRVDGVIAPLRHMGSVRNEVTPASWFRRNLHPSKSYMYYRTAPLGIFSGAILRDPKFQFRADVPAGVDFINGPVLWSVGLNISFYPQDPAYVVGNDAVNRVTKVRGPLADHAAVWADLWDHPVIRNLGARDRKAIAHKIWVTHIFPIANGRRSRDAWLEGDFTWLSQMTRLLVDEVPTLPNTVLRAAAPTLDALLNEDREALFAAQEKSDKQSYLAWRIPVNLVELLGITSAPRRQLAVFASALRDQLPS